MTTTLDLFLWIASMASLGMGLLGLAIAIVNSFVRLLNPPPFGVPALLIVVGLIGLKLSQETPR